MTLPLLSATTVIGTHAQYAAPWVDRWFVAAHDAKRLTGRKIRRCDGRRLHDEDARDRTIFAPAVGVRPPARLRVPTVYAGAAAFVVYELVDDTDWPEQALFRHADMRGWRDRAIA
ncbi:hypothetical protein [Leifsonia aquatica]|uniref:hypothetical protein n=1 Tax=Leifsonia aquatica TaxID=144185 RepID=UPI0038308F0D